MKVYPVVNLATKEILVFCSRHAALDFLLYIAKGPGWEMSQPSKIKNIKDRGEGPILVDADFI